MFHPGLIVTLGFDWFSPLITSVVFVEQYMKYPVPLLNAISYELGLIPSMYEL
jgi:hypothetical protein